MIGIDTNVLVYAAQQSDDPRHLRSARIIEVLITTDQLFIPLQALGEMYHVLRRKTRMQPGDLAGLVRRYLDLADTEAYRPSDLARAMAAVADHGLPFWDALIWSVCDRMAVPILLTEDLQEGRTLGSVTFTNPFGDRAGRILAI
ncbi:PIN domain-containing protein [Geminicoccus roseus]|uniref:PIN domain-containing protein n=1 Tax=Geminicoccus roseus TaxID=404900 RepID=UPI000409E986|nr:PIN domain-containing protein [Geminicoccus roseus]